jgi:hypothetical protein
MSLTRFKKVKQKREILVENPFAASVLSIVQIVGMIKRRETSLPQAEVLEVLDRLFACERKRTKHI